MIIKATVFTLCLLTSAAFAQQMAPLDSASKKKLLDNLNNLIIKSQGAEGKLIMQALSLIGSGCSDGGAAQSLYFDCIKKQNFSAKDSNKVDMDKFRQWSSEGPGKSLASQAGRRALQLQFQWAKITLQAAAQQNKNKIDDQEFDATTFQTQIVSFMQGLISEVKNNDKLSQMRHILSENLLTNAIGKEYGLGSLTPQNWPNSPLAVGEIFEKIVFPNLRKSRNISGLRSAWDKRIECELILKNQESVLSDTGEDTSDNTSRNKKTSGNKSSKNDQQAAKETAMQLRDDLMWQKEVDMYKHGDTGTASVAMYSLIMKMKDPVKQIEKVNQLKNMITKKQNEDIAVTEESEEPIPPQPVTEKPKKPQTANVSSTKPSKPANSAKPTKPAKSAAEQAEDDFFNDI